VSEPLHDFDGDELSGKETCIDCGHADWPHEFVSCDACGNALCRRCSYDGGDDFGNSTCAACGGRVEEEDAT
jgi:hypothetical protein